MTTKGSNDAQGFRPLDSGELKAWSEGMTRSQAEEENRLAAMASKRRASTYRYTLASPPIQESNQIAAILTIVGIVGLILLFWALDIPLNGHH